MKTFILYSFCSLLLFAQADAQAYTGKVSVNRTDEKAVILETEFTSAAAEGAIKEKFDKMGYKGKDRKGLISYEGIAVRDISSDLMDYYFVVEGKGRKDKDGSMISMYMKANNVNVLGLKNSSGKIEKAKGFLNELVPIVAAYQLNQDIKVQEEEVAKAEKKLSKLEDDLSDMEKKIKKLEKDMEDNKADQQKQREEILKLNMDLQNLKARKEQGQ